MGALTDKQKLEKQFIAWALARDDDWWEEGNGHINIWDVRIMLDFVDLALADQRAQLIQAVEKLKTEPFDSRDNGYNEAINHAIKLIEGKE